MQAISDKIKKFAHILRIAATLTPETLMEGLNAVKDLASNPSNFEGSTSQLSPQGMKRIRQVDMFRNGPISLDGVYDTIKAVVGPSRMPMEVKRLVESKFRKAPESSSGIRAHITNIVDDVSKALQKEPVLTHSAGNEPDRNDSVTG